MRTRRLIATLLAGGVLASIGALAAPSPSSASATTPPGYMRCEITWIDRSGDTIDVTPDNGRAPIECYY